jgi:mRNA-degrading endonuclease toxin of MazEF toxin-antitoxin module
VPLNSAELRRGRIVRAIYPFSAQFPAEIIDGGKRQKLGTVEEYVKLRKGQPTELITSVRLRPVLLLHDGVNGDHEDVLCLRINTVKDKHKKSPSWPKIEAHEHRFFYHLPVTGPAGLPQESVIDLTSIGALHKSAIVRFKPSGTLNAHEMEIISRRLVKVLDLDLAHHIATRARELIKRAEQANPGP